MTMKIIGAGFGRTGTASLKLALEKLGFGPCYHMSEVLTHAGHVDLWKDVAAGAPDWNKLFAAFQSTVDFPGATYWRELADYYPNAKIILSLRDPESWWRSTQASILSPKMWSLIEGSPWADMVQKTVHSVFGGKINDHDTLINTFNAHNAAVKAAFGPERLLVFEAKDGWAPLCDFLGVNAPDEPYPRVNSTEEIEGLFGFLSSPEGQKLIHGGGVETPGSVHEKVFEKK